MCTENSRRSACDRCRGQKLRCVRPPKDPHAADPNSLEPCERCVKAGADCIHTVHPHPWRKASRAQPLHQTVILNGDDGHSFSSKESTPSRTAPQSITVQRRSIASTGCQYDQQQKRGHMDRHMPDAPSSVTIFPSHSQPTLRDTSGVDTMSLQPPADINSTSQPCTMDFDNFDFGLRVSPDPISHHDNGATSLTDLFFSTSSDATIGPTCSSRNMSTSLSTPTLTTRSTISTLSGKERCLHRLSELSLQLLKDFGHDNIAELNDILSVSSEPHLLTPDPGAEGECVSPKNTIGRVLEASQIFLKALDHLAQDRSPTKVSSSASECSYSEHGENADLYTAEHYIAMDFDSVGSEHLPVDRNPAVELDMPTILTILTCYTWLLRGYETVFDNIQNALVCPQSLPEKQPTSTIPSILPGLHIGGFSLDHHKELQLEVLLQISTVMLSRIEDVLGMNDATHGILSRASASTPLIDIWFGSKDGPMGDARGDGKRGVGRVQANIEKLRKILRKNQGISCDT